MFSEISDAKGGEPIFQVWGGGKQRGEPEFFQNFTGDQSLTHYALF